jgi:hypothetical protein
LLDSDKTFVGLDAGIRFDVQLTFFQDLKIVRCASGRANRQNQSGQKANQQ